MAIRIGQSDESPREWESPLNLSQQGWRLVAAALIGAAFWLTDARQLPPETTGMTLNWLFVGDPAIALACLALVTLRQRFPFAVAAVVCIASTASTLASGAALLALCSLATRRQNSETAPIAVACVVTGVLTGRLYPNRDGPESLWYLTAFVSAVVIAVVAIGFATGSRREVLRSLQRRAEVAERERLAHAAEARILERYRIAREMHDVLAHRLSLIAMQAGVLGYRTNLEVGQVNTLATCIANGSQQALGELRDVLGILRDGRDAVDGPEPPQPCLALLPMLVADARASGLTVVLTDSTDGQAPAMSQRTAYRVVQEGLTNVGKHAPGATVQVSVEGSAGRGMHVTVADSGGGAGPPVPTSGFGLLGLTERVELSGGALSFGPQPGGGFALSAQLPWPAIAEQRT